MRELEPKDYLTVSIDIKPMRSTDRTVSSIDSRAAEAEAKRIVYCVKDTGVTIKLNTILRARGYGLIAHVRSYGLPMFVDLKLLDTTATLEGDGLFLEEVRPEILTVARGAGPKAIEALRRHLPNTELLCVGVPTSMDDEECRWAYGMTVAETQAGLVAFAEKASLHGVVCAGTEIEMMRGLANKPLEFSAVNIRPANISIVGDDQNPHRAMTPTEAILRGARRVIIGRPVWQSVNPYDTVRRLLDEIALALEKRKTLIAA